MLRIEDTDRERSTPENVEQILDALRWLELDWDEGPILQTRAHRAPPRGARRRCSSAGHAYRSKATAEDVKAYKERHGADRGFRGEPEADGAVRLRVPDEGATVVDDVDPRRHALRARAPRRPRDRARGRLACSTTSRSRSTTSTPASPTWCAARTTSPTPPKQLLVLEAARAVGLGATRPLPRYAHLPLLHGPDGKKLSKRHGAASVQELRDAGYLPAAVRNYLALLGWGAGRRRDGALHRGADRALHARARQPQPGALRRGQAALAERRLHPRAAGGRARRGALEAFTGRDGPAARRRAISQEKIQTLADFWPLAGPLFDGPVDDPAARERWLDEDGRARAGATSRAALAGAAETFDEAARRARAGRVIEARAPSRARSTSRCAWRSPARRSRRGSSRASRCSAARRRLDASTRRSRGA